MTEAIDSFTKRKAPNAYVLFTMEMVQQYKADHPEDQYRFQSIAMAINDPMVTEAWESLPQEQRQAWKHRAREEKHRMVTAFSQELDRYVSDMSVVRSDENASTENRADIDGGENGLARSGGNVSNGESRPCANSLRPPSTTLKRFLRPQKKRSHTLESKYAPAFFDEISTAKQFEEKRRRDRGFLMQGWVWRYAEDVTRVHDEAFYLISSQSFDVRGDQNAPGTIACVEFSIRDGVKRQFCCSVKDNAPDWPAGNVFDVVDCGNSQSPSMVSQFIYGEWMRPKQCDWSSKTPIFFCLVDEYAETYDCLALLYSMKGNAASRFPPTALATVDDLVWALLRFCNIPMTSNNGAVSNEQAPRATQAESFPFTRIINQYFSELAKKHACESHRNCLDGSSGHTSTPSHDGATSSGDGFVIDKNQLCPLAVVQACAAYIKKWVENGHVDDRSLLASSPKVSPDAKSKKQDLTSCAESLKSEDMDRFSYLALSGSDDGSNRTLGSEQGTVDERRDNASDISEDIIVMHPEIDDNAMTAHSLQQSGEETAHAPPIFNCPLSTDQNSLAQSVIVPNTVARSFSCASSYASTVRRFGRELPESRAAEVVETQASVVADSVAAMHTAVSSSQSTHAITHLWAGDFRCVYEAQLQLPFGCRGLGRGVPYDPSLTSCFR